MTHILEPKDDPAEGFTHVTLCKGPCSINPDFHDVITHFHANYLQDVPGPLMRVATRILDVGPGKVQYQLEGYVLDEIKGKPRDEQAGVLFGHIEVAPMTATEADLLVVCYLPQFEWVTAYFQTLIEHLSKYYPDLTSMPLELDDATIEQLPRVPKRKKELRLWKLRWKAIRNQVEQGNSNVVISEWLHKMKHNLACSPDVVRETIEAGEAGLLPQTD